MTEDEAFWALHDGLPRQGPGLPSDVAWAAGVAHLKPGARICDAGCGPGADFEALLAAAPEGHVQGVEKQADFVEAAIARGLDRVDVRQGDMLDITGPYDFIWAAGSLYFLGVVDGLAAWRDALAPGGSVAFSELCWLVPSPPEEARAFWRRYPPMTGQAGHAARIREAGFQTLDTRVLSDDAWESYFGPLEARLDDLRRDGSSPVWAEAAEEIALWRAHRRVFGYLLSVVQPG